MINVIKSGFYTSIQDFGRVNYQDYGVPFSGVMDKHAAILANTLLGNNVYDAVLEMTMTGAVLEFCIPTCIAISGADMSPKLNGVDISINKMIRVFPNDVLSFGKLKSGFRSYLAVLRGFDAENKLDSRSMYENITERFKIINNDKLKTFSDFTSLKEHYVSVKLDLSYLNSNVVEVYRGPEYDALSVSQKHRLFSESFTISRDHNRMAYQLEAAFANDLKPITTSAVLPGTVQLTPSGKLIVLMRDCQTTGGYPRVLQLKASAINILSQKYAGKKIAFSLVS